MKANKDRGKLGAYLWDVIHEQRRLKVRPAAELAGVSPTTLSDTLTGKIIPQAVTLRQIATGLGLDELTLMRLAGYLPPETVPSSEQTVLVQEIISTVAQLDADKMRFAVDFLRWYASVATKKPGV